MKIVLPLFALLLLLAGCETRSISDSGYHHSYGWLGGDSNYNRFYGGELSEFDILGAAPRIEATDAGIAKALAEAAAPQLKRGDRVILIQSGASSPDYAMMEEATRYFDVAPFSGIPPRDEKGMAGTLRLRAAQGGYRYIICYWGVLESAQEAKDGKAISWVPILGGMVTDQKEQMRIRLKALVVDVATGHWKMFNPEVHSDASDNARWTRESHDQKLVVALKEKGYHSLVNSLLL